MRPDERELDEELRGHLAISVRERIEAGEDPEAARLAALRELGYMPAIRDEMRRVWHDRWLDAAAALAQDMRIGLRALRRAKGLALTVILTLALGIGANAAIFSVFRTVLLRPLVNRGEDRLVYIRQGAPGLGAENTTFSVPELDDLRAASKTIAGFGDFSTIDFTVIGLGEPRVLQAGVVGGSYFEVMGLRPALGRLIDRSDDGARAGPVAVLAHRFWSRELGGDAALIGRKIRLGSRTATVIGVLEPSAPYPADTAIIANVAASPHHLGATMVGERTHRMTELFGRLAPGATMDEARAELTAAHAAMMRAHPEAYPAAARLRVGVTPLRAQIAAPARPLLLLLLARSVRREGELAVRAALGASPGALRRTLLAESLVLCGAGALIGLLLARPLVAAVARVAARFSARALDVTMDASVPWVGAALAMAAAVLLAYVPRLPSTQAPTGFGLASAGPRLTPGTRGRLRAFAMTQIACTFVLLAVAGMLLSSLAALQRARTGYDLRQVLAIDVPLPIEAAGPRTVAFFEAAIRRVAALPGVEGAAAGSFVPWRDAGSFGPGFRFAVDREARGAAHAEQGEQAQPREPAETTAESRTRTQPQTPTQTEIPMRMRAPARADADAQDEAHARIRNVSPGFFAVLGIPLRAGRDFTADDRADTEPVVIVSESLARRMFPRGDALDHRLWWSDPYFGAPAPRRIIGVAADADDEHVAASAPAITIYHPLSQMPYGGRLFVRAAGGPGGDPYALAPAVTQAIRALAADQPVERAATLADVRAQVLTPDRVNAFLLAGVAAVALLIAVVGVAGVLAFSVSARTQELGVRLALGSTPRRLLLGILGEGTIIVLIGVAAGAAGGALLAAVAARFVDSLRLPGALPLIGAALILVCAALAAALVPAARAARVDVIQALRAE